MNRGWMAGLAAGLGVATVLFVSTQGLWAQQGAAGRTPTGRVAALDIVKTFNEYDRQRQLGDEMKKEQSRLQAEDTKRRQDLDGMRSALDTLNPTDPTYAKRTRELLAKQIDYKNWLDLTQAQINREIGLWSAQMYKDIVLAAEQLSVANGYDMVIYKDEFELPANLDPQAIRDQIRARKLIYANPAIDITNQIIEKLNGEYRSKPVQPMLQIP